MSLSPATSLAAYKKPRPTSPAAPENSTSARAIDIALHLEMTDSATDAMTSPQSPVLQFRRLFCGLTDVTTCRQAELFIQAPRRSQINDRARKLARKECKPAFPALRESQSAAFRFRR